MSDRLNQNLVSVPKSPSPTHGEIEHVGRTLAQGGGNRMSRWIAGFCVVVLVGAGIAIVQVPSTAGDSWLAILWATLGHRRGVGTDEAVLLATVRSDHGGDVLVRNSAGY